MLQKYCDYLSAVLRLSPLSVTVYVDDFVKYQAYVEQNNLLFETVTGEDIQRFFNEREKKRKLSPSTHVRMISALTHLYNYLLTIGTIKTSPLDTVTKPIRFYKVQRMYSISELQKLIEVPNIKTDIGIRDRCVLELFYATGIRLQELVSLRLFDIDFSDKILFIRGKGNRERLMPLTEPAMTWLNKYLLVRGNFIKKEPPENLFLSRYGTALSSASVYSLVKRHAKRAGLTDFSPHTFRHAYATHLLHNGANLLVLQSLLGHEQLGTTQIYTHIDDNHLEKVHKAHFPRA